MKKKILFISHDASLTGAPILLLRLIASLNKYSDYSIFILLKKSGVLKNDFSQYGDVFIWKEVYDNNPFIWCFQKIKYLINRKNFLKKIVACDIVFNNTVTNAELLKILPLANKRIFNYWHEMSVLTMHHTSENDIEFMSSISEKILVPSEIVKQMFVKKFGISSEKISLLKYIIPPSSPSLEELNVKSNSNFVVGLAGTLYWRKGYDLLPLIAKEIYLNYGVEDISFVWLGADRNLLEYSILNSDLEKLKLGKHFTFIDPTSEISKYLCSLDVLVLPSREDAFPLVVLEAAACGVPSICFKDSGGISEFIENDAGILIDYLDVPAMAKAILKLRNNIKLRNELGISAKKKVGFYSESEIYNQFNMYLS